MAIRKNHTRKTAIQANRVMRVDVKFSPDKVRSLIRILSLKIIMEANTSAPLRIIYVPVTSLKPSDYNPRKISADQMAELKKSLDRFDIVDPIIVNGAPNRKNIVIGGHMRLRGAKELGFKEVPIVYVNIPDIEKEKELNLRLNKNTGEFDWNLLAAFDETFLSDVGFSSEEIDSIFEIEDTPEEFDLEKELAKLKIDKITVQEGDVYDLDGSRLMCGNSTDQKRHIQTLRRRASGYVSNRSAIYS